MNNCVSPIVIPRLGRQLGDLDDNRGHLNARNGGFANCDVFLCKTRGVGRDVNRGDDAKLVAECVTTASYPSHMAPV